MANLLNYNTSGLTGSVTITDKQGVDSEHFIVTVTGNGDGTFTDLKASYMDAWVDPIDNALFDVSDNVGTLIVNCNAGDEITITGKFAAATAAASGPQITNNIINTTAKAVASGTGYAITVDGTAQGMFNGIPKISYGGNAYDMTVTNQTATIIVPINTETVIINGDYLLGDYADVNYSLTNCEIVGDKPVKIKTGQSYTFNFKANQNAELTKINVDFMDNLLDPVSKSGTISADKNTGTITFDLPSGSKDITFYANADVVQTPEIKNYGAINVYVVTSENLNEFAKKRFFKPTGGGETSEEINLGQYVNRIKRIFTSVPVGGDDVLKCGNYNTEIQVKNPKSDVILLNFGTVEISGANGNNEDYNASIKMFIPCKGFVSVDSKYIGKTINLSIKVNVITGDCVAFISCDGVTFQIESFSLSRDVIYRSGTDLNVNGGAQWNDEILYGLEPYILITENITINVPINNTQENVTLKDVKGFSQFENVNLNNADMLVDEYNDIINQLERGVYL